MKLENTMSLRLLAIFTFGALAGHSTAGSGTNFGVSDYTSVFNNDRSSAHESQIDTSPLNIEISDKRGFRSGTGTVSANTVITKDQILRSGAKGIDQLLQQVPGVQLSRAGGPAGLSSFYLRGAEADTTLVLLNDIRIQSANTGFSAISDLPVSSIERIEVIRGPQSALYGSTAPGGIIKIYTIPQKQASQISVSSANSDSGDWQTGISANQAAGEFFIHGQGNWTYQDGIDACALNSACFVSSAETDLDGLEQLSGQLGFQYFNDDGSSIQLSQLYNNSRNEFDGNFSNESESTQKVTSFSIKQPLNRLHQLRFDLGQYNEVYQSLLDSNGQVVPVDKYGTDRYSASVLHETHTTLLDDGPNLSFITGFDFDSSTLVDSTVFPEINRATTGIFSEVEYNERGATIRLGIRRDIYEEENPNNNETRTNYATTGHLKLKLAMNSSWAVKAGMGRNFNMPSFSELYYPGFSNPDLAPETHTSQDIGVEYTSRDALFGLFLFRTKSDDLIVYEGTGPESLGSARIKGVELSQRVMLDQWEIGSSVTYLDAKDATETGSGNQLPRRPNTQFSGYVSHTINRLTSRLGVLSSGSRFDNLSNTREVGGFSVFDLGFHHQTTNKLRLGMRVDNLFDKDYQTVFGYNQPDRSIWIDIDYQI